MADRQSLRSWITLLRCNNIAQMPHPRKSAFSPGTVLPLSLLRCFIAASLAGKTLCAFAGVSFISSSAGFMLHVSGDGAVISNWGAQSPVQGFSGFGQVHLAGRCLTGRKTGSNCDGKAAAGATMPRFGRCRAAPWSTKWRCARTLMVPRRTAHASWVTPVADHRASAGIRTMSTAHATSPRASPTPTHARHSCAPPRAPRLGRTSA